MAAKSAAPSTVIIGAGIVGVATAYYLAKVHGETAIMLVDREQPMSFTSAMSGENYRNWWPHPAMVALTNRSIDLMEEIARDSANRINMTRRGYVLATREANIDAAVDQLRNGLGDAADSLLRYHDGASSAAYLAFDKDDWQEAPDGVDIIVNQALIRSRFPSFAHDVRSIIHIRRGGDISGQQLGGYMLDYLRTVGVRLVTGDVYEIENRGGTYQIGVEAAGTRSTVLADRVVNAAGPFAGAVAEVAGVDLPIFNRFQQKIAFEDMHGAVPRDLPFSIDLDGQLIDWSDEERELLRADRSTAWLAGQMPGAIHCRPEGGARGKWVKLGWAYNETPAPASREPALDDSFPDVVLRGAARLNPALKVYYGRLPRSMRLYGGWYTMTDENWPLIGSMGPPGMYMNCAMSGFGTMAACAAGELCAATIAGGQLPWYATSFSKARYDDEALMSALRAANKGVL